MVSELFQSQAGTGRNLILVINQHDVFRSAPQRGFFVLA